MTDTTGLFSPQTITSSEHLAPFGLCNRRSHELKVCIRLCTQAVCLSPVYHLHFKEGPQQSIVQVLGPTLVCHPFIEEEDFKTRLGKCV